MDIEKVEPQGQCFSSLLVSALAAAEEAVEKKHSMTTSFVPDPEDKADLAHVKVEAHSVIITAKDNSWKIELPRAGHVPISDDLLDKMQKQKWPTPEQGLTEE